MRAFFAIAFLVFVTPAAADPLCLNCDDRSSAWDREFARREWIDRSPSERQLPPNFQRELNNIFNNIRRGENEEVRPKPEQRRIERELRPYVSQAPTRSAPIEDSVVGAFDSFCLAHLDNLTVVRKMLSDVGALKLDAQIGQPFLAGRQGDVWMMKNQATRVMVTATNDGICGTYAPDAAGPEAERLFIANSRSRLMISEPMGTDDESYYAVSRSHPKDQADIHAVVIVAKSRLSSLKGVRFTALPEKWLIQERMRVPIWP